MRKKKEVIIEEVREILKKYNVSIEDELSVIGTLEEAFLTANEEGAEALSGLDCSEGGPDE